MKNMIYILPLKEETLRSETAEHPVLPFVREETLKEDIIEILSTHYPNSGIWQRVPAIRLAREVLDLSIADARDYVNQVEKENAEKIAEKRAKIEWEKIQTE